MPRESMFRCVDYKSHWLDENANFPLLSLPRRVALHFSQTDSFSSTNESINIFLFYCFFFLLLFLCPYRSGLQCTFVCSLDELKREKANALALFSIVLFAFPLQINIIASKHLLLAAQFVRFVFLPARTSGNIFSDRASPSLSRSAR